MKPIFIPPFREPFNLITLRDAAHKITDYKEQRDFIHAHYDEALKNEGFNEKTAGMISSEAYDRGHSAGITEVLSYAIDLSHFVKEIIRVNSK